MGDILDSAKEFAEQGRVAQKIVRSIVEKMLIEPEVDAIGTTGPANYPVELQQFRLNFLNRIKTVSENIHVYYVQAVEKFFQTIILEQWLQKGTQIDCAKLWNNALATIEYPNLMIDFAKLIPKQGGPALAVPKVEIKGEVRDKDGNIK